MKRIFILIHVFLIVTYISAVCQTIQNFQPVPVIEKAKYSKGDLHKILSNSIKYPEQGINKNIQGDVIVSFRISREGRMDSIKILSTPDIILSASSIITINSVTENWVPAIENNSPVDKNYKVVFRYRIYVNSRPVDYGSSAAKSAGKMKYEKALEQYNRAIRDNPYDSDLLESRSGVRELVGDRDGAEKDHLAALKLLDEVMTIIDVPAYGLAGNERRPVTTERVIRSEIVVKESR